MQSKNLALDIRTPYTDSPAIALDVAMTLANMSQEVMEVSKVTEVRSGQTGESLHHEVRVQVHVYNNVGPDGAKALEDINYDRLMTALSFGPGQYTDVVHR